MFDEVRIVNVVDLPAFHNPFKCANHRTFEAAFERLDEERARALAEARHPSETMPARGFFRRRPTEEQLDQQRADRARRINEDIAALLGPVKPYWYRNQANPALPPPPLLSDVERETVSRRVRGALEPRQIAECDYHRCDWVAVACIACDLVEAYGPRVSRAQLEVGGASLPEVERHWLWSLFEHPISWSPGSATVGNGQHRVCGLALSGAKRVPVEA